MQQPSSPSSSAGDPFLPQLHPLLPGIVDGGGGGGVGMFPPSAGVGYGYTASLFAEDTQPEERQQQPDEQQQLLQTQDNERLTLSYHGQVYIFDSVQPQRVQAILLLLSGQELAPENVGIESQPTHLVQPVVVQPPNFKRMAALMRYREKRKNLRFEKRVTYAVRSEVASRMRRKRGQFASSVESSDESLSATIDCEGETTQQNFCTNCGKSRDATPMMRRAPSGSKTFCNACGLMWATKNQIRKPKKSTSGVQDAAPAPAPDIKQSSQMLLHNNGMAG